MNNQAEVRFNDHSISMAHLILTDSLDILAAFSNAIMQNAIRPFIQ